MTIPSKRDSSMAWKEVTMLPFRSDAVARIPAICEVVKSIPFKDVCENSVSVRLQVSNSAGMSLQLLKYPLWKSD